VIAIKNAIERAASPSLTPVKEMLGDGYTYGQIRMVRSFLDREKGIGIEV